MIASMLIVAATFAPPLPVVEVAEINETPRIKQLILHRWYRLASPSHHVAQWQLIGREPLIVWRGGRRIMYLDGKPFVVRSLRYTKTKADPEIANREVLHEENRRPYWHRPAFNLLQDHP